MITKDIVKQLIQETKEIKIEKIIERDCFRFVKDFLHNDLVLVISGVRRSGKSTLMFQLLKELNVSEKNSIYINFEDERLIGLEAGDLEKIYEYFIEINNPNGKVYFFLDEVQEIKYWEKWVRRKYETKKVKFIISGSNSSLISSEFSTALTGRNITINLLPFSFSEYLKLRNVDVNGNLYYSSKKSIIKSYFNDYLTNGGFPQIINLNKNKVELLQQYFTDILYKDIVKRFEIRDVKGFEGFVVYLLSNSSNQTSYYNLRNIFKFSIDTIKEYLSFIKLAHLLLEVPFFSYTLKEQTVRAKKYYSIDTGLRNATSFRFSKDVGKLMENIVLLELKRRNKEVYYWKGKHETDFVVKEGLKVNELINVCFDLNNAKEREVNGLIESLNHFKLKKGLIINEDYLGEEIVEGKKICYRPLWLWLLE